MVNVLATCVLLMLVTAPAAILACDGPIMSHHEDTDPFHGGYGGVLNMTLCGSAPPTFIPLETGAACLDGSPYAFYFIPSTTGSTQWTISIEGGGWCYDEISCLQQANTSLGSSKFFPKAAGCGCMNIDDKNSTVTELLLAAFVKKLGPFQPRPGRALSFVV